MAKITPPQEIPSELLDGYKEAMQEGAGWKDSDVIKKRYPFRLPHMQGNGLIYPDFDMGVGVSYKQFVVRRHFARAVKCWGYQPDEGGVEPPVWGGRNRSWWYAAAGESGLWYYDYFIQQTLIENFAGKVAPWCKLGGNEGGHVLSRLPDETSEAADPFYVGLNRPDEGDVIWSYVKTPLKNRYLWLYVSTCAGDNCDTRYREISYYETTDEWNPRAITWNNKPAPGALIGEQGFTAWGAWITLFIPNVDAIVIKLVSPSDYIYGFSGWVEDWREDRPFTNPYPV